jgi:hypothetical protein
MAEATLQFSWEEQEASLQGLPLDVWQLIIAHLDITDVIGYKMTSLILGILILRISTPKNQFYIFPALVYVPIAPEYFILIFYILLLLRTFRGSSRFVRELTRRFFCEFL